jgi:DNA-binding NarL/FixJ family response regulator
MGDATVHVFAGSVQIRPGDSLNLHLGASRNMRPASVMGSYDPVICVRCVIVDDNAGFREEMRALLEEQGISVVGDAASGTEAIRRIAESRPDVALIDIDLGGESGIALTRTLSEAMNGAPVPKVILISTHDEREYADLIEASPAVGFLAKTDLSAPAIRQMLAGAR